MKRLLAALAIVAALATPVMAQNTTEACIASGKCRISSVSCPSSGCIVTIPQSPDAPGTGGSISIGTIAADILNWLYVAFGSTAGSIIVWILVRVLNKLGIQATDALRARLQEIVVNGLNAGAQQAEDHLQGKGQIEIKNEIVQKAVAYTQEHGADTMKALGLDPQSGKAVEAIKARIETAIADPAAPTPAVLDGAAK